MQDKLKKILEKGLSKGITDSDKQEMLSLFHNSDIEFELKNELLDKLNNTNIHENSSVDFDKLFSELWNKIDENNQTEKPKKRWLIPALRIAAVLIIGLLIGNFFNDFSEKDVVSYYTANCPNGSVSSVVLPDSTIIYLNAGSKIKYSVDGKDGNREVFLNGEAWFDVAKNAEKPFFVHTPIYDVRVTGTKFNVKAYHAENYISTTLEEGEVIIASAGNVKLEDEITLKPGQQAVFNKSERNLRINEVNTSWYTSWKDNKLIFVNMDLDELLVLLERKYGVDIVMKEDALSNLHFDGVIKNETILEIMEILKTTLSINYKIVDQTIEISEK